MKHCSIMFLSGVLLTLALLPVCTDVTVTFQSPILLDITHAPCPPAPECAVPAPAPEFVPIPESPCPVPPTAPDPG